MKRLNTHHHHHQQQDHKHLHHHLCHKRTGDLPLNILIKEVEAGVHQEGQGREKVVNLSSCKSNADNYEKGGEPNFNFNFQNGRREEFAKNVEMKTKQIFIVTVC